MSAISQRVQKLLPNLFFSLWLNPFCLWQNAVLFRMPSGLWDRYALQICTKTGNWVYSSETEGLALFYSEHSDQCISKIQLKPG